LYTLNGPRRCSSCGASPPFVIGELVVIALVIAFPAIALWLPQRMQ